MNMHDHRVDHQVDARIKRIEPSSSSSSTGQSLTRHGKMAHYFEAIRACASQRWDQLESDPELAGPWHQLFKQVQSPRHVLSELLQNADDAGATHASVRIHDETFIFEHNGEDFSEEHFASLCRFGYSNKRCLHTIGFRGIGFKSTFSLGDRVCLSTPTLSVAFDRERFTEPKWVERDAKQTNLTEIRVATNDPYRRAELEKNLQEWLASPVSLLFFRHIRSLTIGDHELTWQRAGSGPVHESEWMALSGKEDEPLLLIRSPSEEFPPEELAEIRQERMLSGQEETHFPPCQVEVVLGCKGLLYVVLPTGVETDLPFACNAPFIQDPARMQIKAPETSPTNRWLLQRAGRLAASAMRAWLECSAFEPAERARAYRLFPDVDRDNNSLEGSCATIAELAFGAEIENCSYLLADSGDLKPEKECVSIPDVLLDIWTPDIATALFDETARPPLSRAISPSDLDKLTHWGVVGRISTADILRVLKTKHLPKPQTWRRLLQLWEFVEPHVGKYHYQRQNTDIRIVPAQGKESLYSAAELIRLGEKKLLQSDKDWQFLADHLLVLNQNWPRFLAEQARLAEERGNQQLREQTESAYAVLEAIGLNTTSDASKVIDQVADGFFAQEEVEIEGCIRLAQIAAKLNATAGEHFRFVTRDGYLRTTSEVVLFDENSSLDELLLEDTREEHVLHEDYVRQFVSCAREEWLKWFSSGRSGLLGFVPLTQKRSEFWGRNTLDKELRSRSYKGQPYFPYSSNHFRIEDWDFDEEHWVHWRRLANEDEGLWSRVVECILAQQEGFWSKAANARAVQIATTGNSQPVTHEPMRPAWIMKFQGLPCLPDTRGNYHQPAELLRRTPETEALLDVELFVHSRLDNEASRRILTLLGVRDTPTGPETLLERLRALAKAESPPVYEVEKWYRRLDQLLETCTSADALSIRQAFNEEKIILAGHRSWLTAKEVFLNAQDGDVPDAPLVRDSVRDLSLWRKVGVAERPTADLAIKWLEEMPSGAALQPDEARRVRAIIARFPERVWGECGHWISLSGEWLPIGRFSFALTMQSLIHWAHLHEWVKQKTADFRDLRAETCEQHPFSTVPALAAHIEDRFHRDPQATGRPERCVWLNSLGQELTRIMFDSGEETARIRSLAARLASSAFQSTPALEIIPYIDGTPAGTPRRAEALWLDETLYVEALPPAKLAKAVVQELGRSFRRNDIADALRFCYERPAEFVTEYLEESFKLVPREQTLQPEQRHLDPSDPDIEPGVTPCPFEHSPQDEDTPALVSTQPSALIDNEEEGDGGDAPEVRAPDGHEPEASPDELENDQLRTVSRLPYRKPAEPGLIERFALKLGFQKDTGERFFHADGSWIAKVGGSFPWEQRASSGELVRRYLPKDHCLEHDSLEITFEAWGLLQDQPVQHALVVKDESGIPREMSGDLLAKLREKGRITLYPATYRLVHTQEDMKS